MGQVLSTETELAELKEAIGAVLYDAMLEGDAVPDLGVVHPLLLASQDESINPGSQLQEHLRHLQSDIGGKAPTYLRDLISRLSTFSDEPRLAGLVGFVVTLLVDMVYTSSKHSSVKGKLAGSSSSQKVWELQEVMEEYLKRFRINMTDKNKLIQDSVRLEAQSSLILTQLKARLIAGDCDSRSLKHWASGAAFNIQMLVHLSALEGQAEPLAAKAALEQYKDDLSQIIPVYRRVKLNTVSVVKCRGGLSASRDSSHEMQEEGSMTGLTVTDKETGKCVTISLSTLESEIGKRVFGETSANVTPSISLDLITSDQYAQAYLDYFFSGKGPVTKLESYFVEANDRERKQRMGKRRDTSDETTKRKEESPPENVREGDRRDENLKLSIVESQPPEHLDESHQGATGS